MSDLREALESAYAGSKATEPDGVDSGAPNTDESPPTADTGQREGRAVDVRAVDTEESSVSVDGAKPGRARDGSGRFAKATTDGTKAPEQATKTEAVAPKAAEVAAATKAPEAAAATATQSPAPELKPPQSWKATVREKWATLPPEVQQEVARVDKEVRQVMQDSAEARKSWQAFQQMVAPYEGLIRAEGSNPLQMVGNLMQTAVALRTAPPAHRARLVAGIVKAYGVPIEALDAELAGQPQQQATQSPTAQGGYEYRDPRVDQLFAQMEAARQQQHQQLQQAAAQEVQSFQGEFMEDVRDSVADMMQLAGQRGVVLSLQDAYNRACWAHPEISKVLLQRQAAQNASNANASTERARLAASSVKSRPAATNGEVSADDLRAVLEAQWSAAYNR